MSAPIFVLGCHRSGMSAVAGLLVKACGVAMDELMPPDRDNPLGTFEAIGVLDAHRGILAQMECDWTCPPSQFDPAALELAALKEQVDRHRALQEPWAVKDPRLMFLLPAWRHLGVEEVRLVAVARTPADTIRSIARRDGMREDRAEALVDAHLTRLVEIAEQVPLPVVQFHGGAQSVIEQVKTVAASLGLSWDDDAAAAFFTEELVTHRTEFQDASRTWERLLATAQLPTELPTTRLSKLALTSQPQWPLDRHLGPRHERQRNELWAVADFSAFSRPAVIEFILEGARLGGPRRPGIELERATVTSLRQVGPKLLEGPTRPDGVVAHQLLEGSSSEEVELFFRSLYLGTHPIAEVVVDVPSPQGDGLKSTVPAPSSEPPPPLVETIADGCGWDLARTVQVSPGRAGMVFRKRILTDTQLVPVVNDLLASIHRIDSMETRLSALEQGATPPEACDREREALTGPTDDALHQQVRAERERADKLEESLKRLENRRIVRVALSLARPFKPLFEAVRSRRR